LHKSNEFDVSDNVVTTYAVDFGNCGVKTAHVFYIWWADNIYSLFTAICGGKSR